MTSALREFRGWLRPWRRFRRSFAERRQLCPALARIDAIDGEIFRGYGEVRVVDRTTVVRKTVLASRAEA